MTKIQPAGGIRTKTKSGGARSIGYRHRGFGVWRKWRVWWFGDGPVIGAVGNFSYFFGEQLKLVI